MHIESTDKQGVFKACKQGHELLSLINDMGSWKCYKTNHFGIRSSYKQLHHDDTSGATHVFRGPFMC